MAGGAKPNQPGFSALLIGVPHYKSDDFPGIATVPNDLHQLRLVLESSGYAGHVRVYPDDSDGDGNSRPLVTGPDIVHELRAACENAPEDGVLFLYFSGHGVSYGNRDYLVPGDVHSLADARTDPELLVKVDLSRYLTRCKARAVVFAVDACRENLNPVKGVRAQATSDFGYGAVNSEHKTRIATIFGCDREQYCYFSTRLKMSLFAKALCQVMSYEHKARTLSEVIRNTDEALASLVASYKPDRVQRVHVLQEGGVGWIGEQVICEGNADSWRSAIHDSPLWQLAADTSDEQVDACRSLAESIASDVWDQAQANAERLPDDPWRDPFYLQRCLRALELLVPPGAGLSIAEILVLTTAPFLAEARQAEAVRQLLDHDPLDLSVGSSGEQGRHELEAVHSAYPRVWQKATTLERAQPTDTAALATWLMYRCTWRQVGLWQEEPVRGLSKQLAAALEQRTGFRGDHAAAFRGIASLLGAGGEELAAFLQGSVEGDRIQARKDAEAELADGARVPLRGCLLAVLLGIAGMLAFDLRRFGEVVVNHVGIRDPLDPVDLRRAVQEAKWVRSKDRTTLQLEARCVHPATHLAFQEACEAVQQQLHAAHRWSGNAGDSAAFLSSLPHAVSTDDLAPERDDEGREVYETPLLQFRLAHNEIRDLLMGARLYGNPALAVRELYQNALDACRYRSFRARYRNQAYTGKITISQDAEDGRPYIECVDNGVGMGRRELENTFSRAGRRFVTSTEFLWEQAEWLRSDKNLRLWPNSQFGIGVFSYFMLADEIFVETAQVDRGTNAPGELLHVQISSSGSLFRITTADRSLQRGGGVAASGGTRIRLYLRDREAEQVSCVDTLGELLWYSEFDVEATQGTKNRTWEARTLKPPGDFDPVDAAGSSLWWVDGEGMLLADGIATDVKPFGYVANLTGENRPALSVDRNKLEAWNQDWMHTQLRAAAARLPGYSGLTFTWLQRFAAEEAGIAQEIMSNLVRLDAALPVASGRPESAMISKVGLWPADTRRIDQIRYFTYPNVDDDQLRWGTRPSYLAASRVKTWQQAGIEVTGSARGQSSQGSMTADGVWARPADTQGHPLLDPIDSAVMVRLSFEREDMSALIRASHRTQRPLGDLLRRIRRFVIHGAVPPPATDADLSFVADEVDVRLLVDEYSLLTSYTHAAAELSHQTGRPLAAVLTRTYLYASLQGKKKDLNAADYVPDSDYVCTAADAGLLSQVFPRFSSPDRYARNGAWLRILLDPGIHAQDAGKLMRVFRAPFESLQELAAAAFTDNPLAKLLSHGADSSKRWLTGEVSLLHLLIGSSVTGEPPGAVAEAIAPYQETLGYRLPADLSALPRDPVPGQAGTLLRIFQDTNVPSSDEELKRTGGAPGGYITVIALSYRSGLAPRSVVQALAPYQTFLRTAFPDDVSRLPDRAPTDEEIEVLDEIVDDDLRTSPALLLAAAGELHCELASVQKIAHLWRVPVRDDREPDEPVSAPGQAASAFSDEAFAALDNRDRRLLSQDLDGRRPYYEGVLSPARVVRAALANRETIGMTLERVERLSGTFPVATPDFDWGTMRHAELPAEFQGHQLEPFDAATALGLAYDLDITVASVFRRLMSFAPALDLPSVTDHELSMLERQPDEWDLVTLVPIDRQFRRYRERQPYLLDAWHVIRVAGRLGLSIGAVTARIAGFAPILEELPPDVTAEAREVVPDWRDLVILTPGLDGRRLLTDEDLTEAHIACAAREVETTPEDVRQRLARYASYCQFTVPGEAEAGGSLPEQDDDL